VKRHRGARSFSYEVGELSPDSRPKLAPASCQGRGQFSGSENRPDMPMFRMLAATNRDLETDRQERSLRGKIFVYRNLNVIEVRTPPCVSARKRLLRLAKNGS